MRDSLSMAMDSRPWTPHHELRGLPNSDRMRDLIDVSYHRARRDTMDADTDEKEVPRGLFLDVSQGMMRARLCRDLLNSFGTKSMVYSYEHDIVLSGASHLQLFGWSRDRMSNFFSDDTLRDLAGESISVPSLAIVLLALWMNPFADWWPSMPNDDEEMAAAAAAQQEDR